VTASLAGFSTTKRPNLSLSIGQTLTVDVSMQVSGAQEEVTVTAEAPLIEPARTHQATTVGAVAVANLPVNGRNFIDFALTTPGVTRDTRGGDISFAGLRGVLNSLVIDGADNNNTFFGQTPGAHGFRPRPLPVQPGRGGGVPGEPQRLLRGVRPRGRSRDQRGHEVGHNDFHGSAFEFFRDKSLNANTWANKIANPVRARAPFRIHQFGGSVGGPIQKDKAFFFFSYDGQRRNLPNTLTR
jgi:hypothetical protein